MTYGGNAGTLPSEDTVTVYPSLLRVEGIRTSPPPWAELVIMPLDMDRSRIESLRAWSVVAATTMSEPSMYSPAVEASTALSTTSSARSLNSGRMRSATTLILNPSKCLHLRGATLPPPKTVTSLFPGERTIGDISTLSTYPPLVGDPLLWTLIRVWSMPPIVGKCYHGIPRMGMFNSMSQSIQPTIRPMDVTRRPIMATSFISSSTMTWYFEDI